MKDKYLNHPNKLPTLTEEEVFNIRSGSFKSRPQTKICDFVCSLCNKTVTVHYGTVKRGLYKVSCGCHKKRYRSTHKKEYKAWSHIIQRCTNPNIGNFKNYGGRGIKVCDSWRISFENFLKDMGKAPALNYSVERIDVNKDYSKENCKWIPINEQVWNTRASFRITVENKTFPLIKCTKYLDVDHMKVYHRIKRRGKIARDFTLESFIKILTVRVKDKEIKEEIGKNMVNFIKENA